MDNIHTCNGPFSGTTRVSRYPKGKLNLDFTEARDSEWQWHQPGHIIYVYTSLQTYNHAGSPAPHHSVFTACLSQVGVLLKRLNTKSHNQHRMIARELSFSDAKDLREIRPGSPPAVAPNAGGVSQNRRLSTNSWLYLENGTR